MPIPAESKRGSFLQDLLIAWHSTRNLRKTGEVCIPGFTEMPELARALVRPETEFGAKPALSIEPSKLDLSAFSARYAEAKSIHTLISAAMEDEQPSFFRARPEFDPMKFASSPDYS